MPWHKYQDFLDQQRVAKLPAMVCLFGSDLYLRKMIVSALEEKLGGGKKVERENFYASESSPEQMLTAASTYSMFAKEKAIIVHQFQAWTAKQRSTALEFLEKPNPQTMIVLVADDPPGDYWRKKEYGKWFDGASGRLEIIDLTDLKESEVKDLIDRMARELNKRISSEAAGLLVELVGARPELIFRELEKISLAMGEGKAIGEELVHELVVGSRLQSIFDFTNALGRKDLGRALKIYHQMQEQNPSQEIFWYVQVLNMIKRHYRILIEAQAGLGSERALKSVMERNRIFPSFRKDYVSQAEKFSRGQLLEYFDKFHATELELWRSRIDAEIIQTVTESNVLMEKLIFDLCGA